MKKDKEIRRRYISTRHQQQQLPTGEVNNTTLTLRLYTELWFHPLAMPIMSNVRSRMYSEHYGPIHCFLFISPDTVENVSPFPGPSTPVFLGLLSFHFTLAVEGTILYEICVVVPASLYMYVCLSVCQSVCLSVFLSLSDWLKPIVVNVSTQAALSPDRSRSRRAEDLVRVSPLLPFFLIWPY